MKTRTPRIVGIDVARGLAVLGMFVAHTYPRHGDEELLVDGRSAILFATLAGVSLGLLSGGEAPARVERSVVRRGVAIRAAFLFLLGVALSLLPSHIAVILDYYGFMFALMIPLLFAPWPVLALLAGSLAVLAPLAAEWLADTGPGPGWPEVAAQYLLIGRYPALVWLPFLLVGLLCARLGLDRPQTQRWMIAGGACAMVVGYGSAFLIGSVTAEAHSGSTAEIVGSGGFAVTLIGVLLWVHRFRASRIISYPIAAAGSMPLTIYTLQLVALAACVVYGEFPGVPDYPGFTLMLWLIAGSLAFGSLWRWLLGSGPLERILRFLAGFDRSAARRSR